MAKCPKCKAFIVLESTIPVYKNGKVVELRKFVECVNGHRVKTERKQRRKRREVKKNV